MLYVTHERGRGTFPLFRPICGTEGKFRIESERTQRDGELERLLQLVITQGGLGRVSEASGRAKGIRGPGTVRARDSGWTY